MEEKKLLFALILLLLCNPANLAPCAADNVVQEPELLVFVSFSMPETSLKTLAQQVRKADGKLIFRGLVNGSFKLMSEKLRHLGEEVWIDPTLFAKYKITKVPTFIYRGRRLTGNVTLDYALKKMRNP